MLRLVLALMVVALASLAGTAMSQEPTSGTSGANGPGGAGAGKPESAPWYSLLFDNRSDRFAALRLERTELMRKVTELESEVKDLREKNAALDDQIARFRESAGAISFARARSTSISLDSEIAQKTVELKQTEERMKLDLTAKNAEQASLPTAGGGMAGGEDKRRAELKAEIAELELYIAQERERRELEIKQLQDEKQAVADAEKRYLAEEAERKTQRENELASVQSTLKANTDAIVAKRAELAKFYARIDVIDAEVLKLIDVGDTDGWFKIIISLSFALLVGGVIFGFFLVIRGETGTVSAIFSADAGIQFVTIFSIIIAVILFGIIGVLEGKELSALLGGLSGYILGRSSMVSRNSSQTGTTAGAGGKAPTGGPGGTGGGGGGSGTTGVKDEQPVTS